MTVERLYADDIRATPGRCMKGARRWFAARGLDWNDFLDNGISADFIRELDDPISNSVLATAESRRAD